MVSRSEFLEKVKDLLTEEDKKQVASSAKKYLVGGIILIILTIHLLQIDLYIHSLACLYGK